MLGVPNLWKTAKKGSENEPLFGSLFFAQYSGGNHVFND